MVCFRERGLTVSFYILCLFFHVSQVVHPLKLGHLLPPCLTPTHLTTRPFSPFPFPPLSLHSQCLALKGRKNAKPAQISVIISFTGAGLMSLGGPGFAYTKDRVKSWRGGYRDSGRDCMNEYVRREMSLFITQGLVGASKLFSEMTAKSRPIYCYSWYVF